MNDIVPYLDNMKLLSTGIAGVTVVATLGVFMLMMLSV